jgi:hypothetical protein
LATPCQDASPSGQPRKIFRQKVTLHQRGVSGPSKPTSTRISMEPRVVFQPLISILPRFIMRSIRYSRSHFHGMGLKRPPDRPELLFRGDTRFPARPGHHLWVQNGLIGPRSLGRRRAISVHSCRIQSQNVSKAWRVVLSSFIATWISVDHARNDPHGSLEDMESKPCSWSSSHPVWNMSFRVRTYDANKKTCS